MSPRCWGMLTLPQDGRSDSRFYCRFLSCGKNWVKVLKIDHFCLEFWATKTPIFFLKFTMDHKLIFLRQMEIGDSPCFFCSDSKLEDSTWEMKFACDLAPMFSITNQLEPAKSMVGEEKDGWNPARYRKSPPEMVLKAVVNNGINYQPQLVNARFQPSTVWVHETNAGHLWNQAEPRSLYKTGKCGVSLCKKYIHSMTLHDMTWHYYIPLHYMTI